MNEEEMKTHPSFGVITMCRMQCGPPGARLFMSPLHHQHFIALEIKEAQLIRSLNEDRTFAGRSLIRVEMTESQLARMVTSAGDGGGTPCTISRINNKSIERCPEDQSEKKFYDEVAQSVKESADLFDDLERMVKEVFDKKTPTKADRAAVLDKLFQTRRRLDDHLPFAVEQFHRHMDVVVDQAKTEVDAYVNAKIMAAGLAALNTADSPSMAQLAAHIYDVDPSEE